MLYQIYVKYEDAEEGEPLTPIGEPTQQAEALTECRRLSRLLTLEASTATGSHNSAGHWYDACIADYSYVVRPVA